MFDLSPGLALCAALYGSAIVSAAICCWLALAES
jgi:hypothetical protein